MERYGPFKEEDDEGNSCLSSICCLEANVWLTIVWLFSPQRRTRTVFERTAMRLYLYSNLLYSLDVMCANMQWMSSWGSFICFSLFVTTWQRTIAITLSLMLPWESRPHFDVIDKVYKVPFPRDFNWQRTQKARAAWGLRWLWMAIEGVHTFM